MDCRLRHVAEHLDPGASDPPYRLVAKKKSLIASERDRWQRAAFALEQADLDATKLVVIDEVGSNLDLTPTYAWAPVGERAVTSAPRNTALNTSTIASLTHQGMGPALMLKGGVDRLTFETYLQQVLAPTLQPGQVVLVDNLSVHQYTCAGDCGGVWLSTALFAAILTRLFAD